MDWMDYTLVAAGCMALIAIVLGLVESLVWGRWEREQHRGYVAGLEDDYRAAYNEARSLRQQIAEIRGNYGHQREQAMLDGYEKGFADGHEQNPEYEAAFTDGYDEGHADGYTEGYIEGYARGRDGEHKYWTSLSSDDCAAFGLERPTGIYDEPDTVDPEVVARLNGAEG